MTIAEPTEAAWLVLQVPGSGYSDVEGRAYHYPLRTEDSSGAVAGRSIANAKRIASGDYIVSSRTAKTSDGPGRVFGVGRVGEVIVGRGDATARYAAYVHLDPRT